MGSRRDCTWILGLPGFRVERVDGEDGDATLRVRTAGAAVRGPEGPQLNRLWTYKTRPGVLDFLLGWIKALRWQRLPEMERLGDFLFKHIEGIAAYCDHPVRFGVVESINTTIKSRNAPRSWEEG